MREAFVRLGFVSSLAEEDLVAWRKLAAPLHQAGGDVYFALAIEAERDQLTVTAQSLHRPAELFGRDVRRVKLPAKPAWQKTALEAALRRAITRALADLEVRAEELVGKRGRPLMVSARINGLDAKARQYVEQVLLPCVRGLFDTPPGVPAQVREQAGFVDYAFFYLPEKDEPREPLGRHVERVRLAIGSQATVDCSLAGSPLERHAISVSADELNQAVRIVFGRPR